ncbi:hypothetical protein PoB_002492600 [Plakobranchus ocellatus]|uniref:Uncharacterized protein n=1 Tax=Plakobranchus ocellatus TaxID=259542 RepID=A0AAV3ZGY2_9GAST|nr:hypothetical protein PoB_002492600 [Plakobranchus ocellatus]
MIRFGGFTLLYAWRFWIRDLLDVVRKVDELVGWVFGSDYNRQDHQRFTSAEKRGAPVPDKPFPGYHDPEIGATGNTSLQTYLVGLQHHLRGIGRDGKGRRRGGRGWGGASLNSTHQHISQALIASMMLKMLNVCVMSLLVTCAFVVDNGHSLAVDNLVKQPSPVHVRERRNANQQTTPSSGDLTDIIRHLSSTENILGNFDLMQYTPSTPSPENVNCYVEVPVTRRVGGRCVSLGTNAMGCQAGVYLALSSECQALNPQTSLGGGLFPGRSGRRFNRRRSIPPQ